MILAGDISATRTRLAVFDDRSVTLSMLAETTCWTRDYPSLEDAVFKFLARGSRRALRGACFAAAGPVVEGRSEALDVPWVLDEVRLAKVLHTRVRLLSGTESAAYGLLALGPQGLATLQPGVRHEGNLALITVGTGLGEALLVPGGDGYRVVSTEAGHVDFAPRTDAETALLGYLRAAYGHVGYERVLSAAGLFDIYRFLRDSGHAAEPEWLRDALTAAEPSSTIIGIALAGGHPLCTAALDLFVAVWGARAGNLALESVAVGGLFVGGSLAPRILPKLREGQFVEAFRDKDRVAGLLRSIPVSVVVDPRVTLLGAALVARDLGRS
jgi:glucokinase